MRVLPVFSVAWNYIPSHYERCRTVIRELHRIFSGCVEHWQRTSVEMPTCKIREQNITSVSFSKKISPVIFPLPLRVLLKILLEASSKVEFKIRILQYWKCLKCILELQLVNRGGGLNIFFTWHEISVSLVSSVILSMHPSNFAMNLIKYNLKFVGYLFSF